MKTKLIIIIVVIAFIAFAYMYTEPIHISKFYEGCLYSNSEDLEKKVIIKVEGELHRRIIGEDFFEGTIEVDGAKEEIIAPRYTSALSGLRNKMSTSHYTILGKVKVDSKTGKMTSSNTSFKITRDFELLWGYMGAINEKYNTKCLVAAPCDNKEAGDEIVKKILGF